MRLLIKRWYEPPASEEKYSSPYRAHAVLELSEEEKDIIEKYQLGGHILTQSKFSVTTLDDLVRGSNEFQSDIDIAISNEKVLRDACAGLPAILEYCRSFGGEISIDY